MLRGAFTRRHHRNGGTVRSQGAPPRRQAYDQRSGEYTEFVFSNQNANDGTLLLLYFCFGSSGALTTDVSAYSLLLSWLICSSAPMQYTMLILLSWPVRLLSVWAWISVLLGVAVTASLSLFSNPHSHTPRRLKYLLPWLLQCFLRHVSPRYNHRSHGSSATFASNGRTKFLPSTTAGNLAITAASTASLRNDRT